MTRSSWKAVTHEGDENIVSGISWDGETTGNFYFLVFFFFFLFSDFSVGQVLPVY